MELEDFVDSEVAIAVAATAAVLSPRVRGLLRTGAVYGLAGALTVGDAVSTAAGGVRRGARQAASSAGGVVQQTTDTAGGVARSAAERARGGARSAESEA